MLLGVAQMSWSADVFYMDDYDSSAKTATLKWGEAPAWAITFTINDFWTGNSWSDVDKTGNIVTLSIDASCQDHTSENLAQLFSGFSSLTTINNLSNLKTATVTNMKYLFEGCSSLTTLDVSSFNTAHVNYMNGMFQNCSELTTLDLSTFDTESVLEMTSMFDGCTNLETLNLTGSKFRPINVENISRMFYNCQKLTDLDLSKFNSTSLSNVSNMFYRCYALESIDMSGFNSSNLTSLSGLFSGCSSLKSLDLRSFDTTNVTNMSSMFSGCTALTAIDLSSFNTSRVENMNSMFFNCSSLKAIIVNAGKWTTDGIKEGDYGKQYLGMFNGCTSLVGEDGTTLGTTVDGTKATTGTGGYLTKHSIEVSTTLAGDAAWGTYYKSNVNRQADALTTVYAAKKIDETLTLVEVEDRIIKAGQGVILKRATATASTLTSTAEAATESYYEDNALSGCDQTTSQTAGTTYYVLSYQGGVLGFYKYGSGNTLGANKAFLAVTGGESAPAYFSFDDETTAISEVENGTWKMDDSVYDLQGRRVKNPTSGLYIVNGKKVIIR